MFDALNHCATVTDHLLHMEDGAAVLHTTNAIPITFKMKALDITSSKRNLIFSTDSYFPDSIKSQEKKRGATRSKIMFFCRMLKTGLSSISCYGVCNEVYDRLKDRDIILITEGVAQKFTASDGQVIGKMLTSLTSNQRQTLGLSYT